MSQIATLAPSRSRRMATLNEELQAEIGRTRELVRTTRGLRELNTETIARSKKLRAALSQSSAIEFHDSTSGTGDDPIQISDIIDPAAVGSTNVDLA